MPVGPVQDPHEVLPGIDPHGQFDVSPDIREHPPVIDCHHVFSRVIRNVFCCERLDGHTCLAVRPEEYRHLAKRYTFIGFLTDHGNDVIHLCSL